MRVVWRRVAGQPTSADPETSDNLLPHVITSTNLRPSPTLLGESQTVRSGPVTLVIGSSASFAKALYTSAWSHTTSAVSLLLEALISRHIFAKAGKVL
jgi:hypothetical protein